jgi:hypothetical protein
VKAWRAAAARLADVAAAIDYGEPVSQLAATEFPRPPPLPDPRRAAAAGP